MTLSDLNFDDVFEDMSTGKFYTIVNKQWPMIEVKEVGTRRFWAWPHWAKVKFNN